MYHKEHLLSITLNYPWRCALYLQQGTTLFEKVTETKHSEQAEIWPVACIANNRISIPVSLLKCLFFACLSQCYYMQSGIQGPLNNKTPFLSLVSSTSYSCYYLSIHFFLHTEACALAYLWQHQRPRGRGDIKAIFTIMKFSEDKNVANFLDAN